MTDLFQDEEEKEISLLTTQEKGEEETITILTRSSILVRVDSDISTKTLSSSVSLSLSSSSSMRQRLDTEETYRIHNIHNITRTTKELSSYTENNTPPANTKNLEKTNTHKNDLHYNHPIEQNNNPAQRRSISYEEHEKDEREIVGIPSTLQFYAKEDDDDFSFESALTTDEGLFSHHHRDGKDNHKKTLSSTEESRYHCHHHNNISSGNGVALPLPHVEVPFFKKPSSKNINRMDQLIANLAAATNDKTNTTRPTLQSRAQSSLSISCNDTRPSTISRKSSCPTAAELSRISNSFTTSPTGSTIPENSPIVLNGVTLMENRIRHRDGSGRHNQHSDASDGGGGKQLQQEQLYSKLVGTRRRRFTHHRRCHSGAEISVGSLVGQSTLLTERSSVSETVSSAEDASRALRSLRQQASTVDNLLLKVTGADDGIGCCQVAQRHKKKNFVKKEFQYVVGVMTSPIVRLLPGKKPKLQRSNGSLV